jgi:polyisoprenoid-binding protein YceI
MAGLLLLTMSTGAFAQAASYTLDGSHTAVIFSISHFGYSFTYGRFNKVEGSFSVDNANPAASQFNFSIDAASIDSNDPKRDEHLRGPDFFNVKQFPTIKFTSTGVKPTKDGVTVSGKMTMHGVTKQVDLPMRKVGEGKGPYGKYRVGYYLQTTLKRSDFGMTQMIPKLSDEVSVTISFEGIKN